MQGKANKASVMTALKRKVNKGEWTEGEENKALYLSEQLQEITQHLNNKAD